MAARDRDEKKPRRKRRFGVLSVLNFLLTLVLIGMLVAGGVLAWGISSFYAQGQVKADTPFVVERGSRLATIAERLEEQGLIDNHFVFQYGTIALKKQAEFRAGEYLLKANYSMDEVLHELTEGKPITYQVVIPEGFTAAQVVERLNANTDLSGDPIQAPPAEGSILPQSYDYERGSARADVLTRMEGDMADAVAQVYANCVPRVCGNDGVVHSSADLVTLASMVEKETGVATERPMVAAVFVNRLKKGMRLQSDPTIIYGITHGQTKLDRPLKKSEIEAKTPYNTYQLDGLPAGPIANPGIDALKAVANPADTNDIYFVAKGADPKDGHLFAATYKDHQKNVASYRDALVDAEAEAEKQALEEQQAKKAGTESNDTPEAPK